MDKTEQLIAKTERLLAQIETLQATMHQLQGELKQHGEELAQQLTRVRKKPAQTQPIRPLTTAERRSAPRRKGNPISVYITNGSPDSDTLEGWVMDRSSGGLRLLVDEPLPPGTLLNVRPVKALPHLPWIQVRVKNCFPERKSWSLGCQFLHKMSWEDLQHFG